MTKLEPDHRLPRRRLFASSSHAERAAWRADLADGPLRAVAATAAVARFTVPRRARAPHRGGDPWPRPLAGRRDLLPVTSDKQVAMLLPRTGRNPGRDHGQFRCVLGARPTPPSRRGNARRDIVACADIGFR